MCLSEAARKDKKLEVSDVKFSPKETIVTVKRKPAPTANEKNPYILIGLDKIAGDFIVQDETETDLKKRITSNKAGVLRTSGFFFYFSVPCGSMTNFLAAPLSKSL